MQLHRLSLAILTLSALGLGGCSLDGEDVSASVSAEVSTNNTIALTELSQLISFDRYNPAGSEGTVRMITGLRSGDALVAIDYRPSTGKLYGLGKNGNLYMMNAGNGVASFLLTLKADPTDTSASFNQIDGDPAQIGMAFDPVTEQLRVFTEKGQNLRINVDTGTVITDPAISTSLTFSGAAYTNNVTGSTSTRLFAIDAVNFCLQEVSLSDFSVGTCHRLTLKTGNRLSFKNILGFEIDGLNNVGYAMLKIDNEIGMYQLDLSSIDTGSGVATKSLGTAFSFDTITNANRVNIRSIATKPHDLAYGLTADNQLIRFSPEQPSKVGVINITGLVEANNGEKIIGIDRRPYDQAASELSDDTGTVYALSNKGYLYKLNLAKGVASDKHTLTIAKDSHDPFTQLDGTRFSVDFDSASDRLRVISNTGQNLSIDVDGPYVTTHTPINGVDPSQLSAVAYTNNFRKANATTSFALDGVGQQLLTQNTPSSGTVSSVGAFGKDVGNHLTFDIAGSNNEWALMTARTTNNTNQLYRVNLQTGGVQPYRLSGDREALSVVGDDKTPAFIDLMLVIQMAD